MLYVTHLLLNFFPQLVDISTKGQAMIQKMEDSPKPVVAAIHGSCLGGGAEVSSSKCSVVHGTRISSHCFVHVLLKSNMF